MVRRELLSHPWLPHLLTGQSVLSVFTPEGETLCPPHPPAVRERTPVQSGGSGLLSAPTAAADTESAAPPPVTVTGSICQLPSYHSLHWYLFLFIESSIGRLRAPAAPAVGLCSHGYTDPSALPRGLWTPCWVLHRTRPLLRYRGFSPSPLSGVLSVPTGVQLGLAGPSLPHPSAAGVTEQSPHGNIPLSQSDQRESSR